MKKSLKIIKSHKIEHQWDNGDESDKHVETGEKKMDLAPKHAIKVSLLKI